MSFLYVDEDDDLLRGVLADHRYLALPGQTAYSMPVPDDASFDTYLARFEQRRRVKLKRELRALNEAEVSYRTQPLTADIIERLAPLELALYAKYGTPANADAFTAVLHSIAAESTSRRNASRSPGRREAMRVQATRPHAVRSFDATQSRPG